jgi:hypothetical protein
MAERELLCVSVSGADAVGCTSTSGTGPGAGIEQAASRKRTGCTVKCIRLCSDAHASCGSDAGSITFDVCINELRGGAHDHGEL